MLNQSMLATCDTVMKLTCTDRCDCAADRPTAATVVTNHTDSVAGLDCAVFYVPANTV